MESGPGSSFSYSPDPDHCLQLCLRLHAVLVSSDFNPPGLVQWLSGQKYCPTPTWPWRENWLLKVVLCPLCAKALAHPCSHTLVTVINKIKSKNQFIDFNINTIVCSFLFCYAVTIFWSPPSVQYTPMIFLSLTFVYNELIWCLTLIGRSEGGQYRQLPTGWGGGSVSTIWGS